MITDHFLSYQLSHFHARYTILKAPHFLLRLCMRTFSECSPRACRVSVSGWGFVRGLLLRHYVLPYQRPRRDSVLAYHPAYVATLRQRLEHYNTQGSHYYPYQFHVYTISCGNLLWVVFEPLKVCLTPTMIRNVRGVVLYI